MPNISLNYLSKSSSNQQVDSIHQSASVETKPSSLAIVKTPIESVFVNGDAVERFWFVSFEIPIARWAKEITNFFLQDAVRRK
jgi:hypothetical protein